jgi:LPXTG-motif cell wall-anchored protein
MYHRGQLPIKVLVQPVQNHLKKFETRQIKRPIILNLPGGKKVVDQVIKLSREVTAINEHLNFYSNGPWKIEKEEKVEIPQVDFYVASMTQIPTFVIGESVKSVEINYSLVKKGEDSSQTGRVESQSTSTQTEGQKEQDSQTETPTISNNSVQTETNQHITDNSQQTDPEQLSNEDTQTTDTGKDNETQTTALSETSTQTQTEGSSGKSEETQTESNNKNENNQTEGLHSQSASSQTEELKEQISQTELPVASSEGVQTDLNKDRSDSAQQTDPKLVSNQETQVNLVGEHKGTQTHKLTKADEYTQSEERFCKSEGSQTEMIINSDNATQTERLVGELTTQIEQKEETDSSTQTVNKGQKENSSNPSQTMETERMPKESYSETQNNSDNVDNTEKSFLDDSEIQKILDQDSKELKKLKGSSKHNKSVPNGKEKLPQTGNQTDNKTTIAELGIISIITALTATFWKKKEKE